MTHAINLRRVSRGVPRVDSVLLSEDSFRVGRLRRCLDVVLASLGMVVAGPLIAVAALAVLVSDGRPVFFRQRRVGEHARPFTLYKLRSMRSEGSGPEVTAGADVRVTPVGAVLRRLSIDELPQLWHVLRGEMTLVGPRPESVALADRYPASCRVILQARPGLTGPAQLTYREQAATPPPGWSDVDSWYLKVLVPLRIDADLSFLTRPTLGQTLRYLALTALFVVGLVDLQRQDFWRSEPGPSGSV